VESAIIISTAMRRRGRRIAVQYVLLVYGCDRPEPGDPRFEDALKQVNAFHAECRKRDVVLAWNALKPVETATTVRLRDGRTLITDGPFAETYEQFGGYYLLDCRGLDEALELAALCPMAQTGSVEVRPIAEIPGMQTAVNTDRSAVADA
jgi:hypothetical protein